MCSLAREVHTKYLRSNKRIVEELPWDCSKEFKAGARNQTNVIREDIYILKGCRYINSV